MKAFLRSLVTACCIAGAVQIFAVGALAPRLLPVKGRLVCEAMREMTLPAAPLLRLRNQDGSVHVRTHELADIRIEADIQAHARDRGVEQTAQAYVASLITVDATAEELSIVSEPGERPDELDVSVDYHVFVPEGTDVAVHGANGNVWVSKGCGRVAVQGHNTDIEIVEAGGPVLAQSTNGRIRVLDAKADTTLVTVNGNVYAHMDAGTLRAVTTNGAIVAHMNDPDSEKFDLQSKNGGITLVMDDRCSAQIDATTGRGVIKSDFTLSGVVGERTRQRLQATIGAGHTKLIMNTLNGNIWIARRQT
ncbi:MAG TPA: DUF4097 family beta strand repeat-containing protein [Candidatus Hydrogenedentes bacterium]|nr:DUF4097 family beta strand repeat-containing protein [Candidatus Hydrogenedentota bacterium]HPG66325.1 DUF4097 family beta strand repeat-containing protein [Candidatus Hydrogenedentota bacterium]